MRSYRTDGGSSSAGTDGASGRAPGKQTLTQRLVQRKPAAKEAENDPPAAGTEPVLDAGEQALEAGEPDIRFDPNDLEGDSWTFRFRNPAVDALLRHLIVELLGEADPEPLCVVAYDAATASKTTIPPWVRRFRTKAISVNSAGAPTGGAGGKPDAAAARQQRMAALATRLADAIKPRPTARPSARSSSPA